MFGNRPAAGANATSNPKKPTIRRETVRVPVRNPQSNGVAKATSSPQPPTNRFQLSQRPGARPSSAPSKRKTPVSARRAIAASGGLKRKSATPEHVHFSSDEDEGSSDVNTSDSDVSRKRFKSSVSSVGSTGPQRNVLCEAAFQPSTQQPFVQGADATSGEHAGKFKNPWNQDECYTVELQYPSRSPPECFELKWPKNEKDDYKPMEDITETIKQVVLSYFPDDLCAKYSNDENGFSRRITRAWQHQSIPEFIEIVHEYNTVLSSLVNDGTISRALSHQRSIPFDTVRRILDQIYARTVSPKVETLRAYQNGSDNVYGELLARFCSTIFAQTALTHNQVFLDLGSGVGNVVLQAALEIGCESWGIEMMKNPCELADLQAREFPARTHLWGLSAGSVNLLRGDMTDHPGVAAVLPRADVVLVNNQAFTPQLNDKLRDMFLDLKTGCRVVSLKPFVPEGHKISLRNISSVANLFVQQRYEYFSGSVSWTDVGGYYYIATKDPRPLEAFTRANRGR